MRNFSCAVLALFATLILFTVLATVTMPAHAGGGHKCDLSWLRNGMTDPRECGIPMPDTGSTSSSDSNSRSNSAAAARSSSTSVARTASRSTATGGRSNSNATGGRSNSNSTANAGDSSANSASTTGDNAINIATGSDYSDIKQPAAAVTAMIGAMCVNQSAMQGFRLGIAESKTDYTCKSLMLAQNYLSLAASFTCPAVEYQLYDVETIAAKNGHPIRVVDVARPVTEASVCNTQRNGLIKSAITKMELASKQLEKDTRWDGVHGKIVDVMGVLGRIVLVGALL